MSKTLLYARVSTAEQILKHHETKCPSSDILAQESCLKHWGSGQIWVWLCSLFLMLQAAFMDCQFLDTVPFSDDGFVPVEVDIR